LQINIFFGEVFEESETTLGIFPDFKIFAASHRAKEEEVGYSPQRCLNPAMVLF
jgi:hypothetical protein